MSFNNKVGSGFTNIQKYLGANKDNKLGSTINSGIQNQVQQTQNNLSSAQNEFQNQLNSNKYNVDEGKNLINGATSADSVTDDQAKRFQQLKAGMYQGPQALNNAQQLQGQAQDTKQLGQATGTTAGRYGLLQKYAGRGQYNQGQQRLDNLILGQTGQQDLNQARRSTAGIDNQVSGALNVAGQQAQQAATNNQQVGQQLGTTLDTENQNVVNQAQGEADALTKQRLDQYKDYEDISGRLGEAQKWLDANPGKSMTDYLTQDYSGEQKATGQGGPRALSIDDLKKLNIGDDIFVNQLNTKDLINSIKSRSQAEQDAKVTAQQAANDQELARSAALAKLGGGQQSLVKDANGPSDFNALSKTDLQDYYKNTDDYKSRDSIYNALNNAQAGASAAFLRDVGAVDDPSGGYLGLGRGRNFLTGEQGQQAIKAVQDAVINGKDAYSALSGILGQSSVKDELLNSPQAKDQIDRFYGGNADAYLREIAGQIYQRNTNTEHGGVGNIAAQQAKFRKLSDLISMGAKANNVNKL